MSPSKRLTAVERKALEQSLHYTLLNMVEAMEKSEAAQGVNWALVVEYPTNKGHVGHVSNVDEAHELKMLQNAARDVR